jgi:Tfp pilus assembly protein PilZ
MVWQGISNRKFPRVDSKINICIEHGSTPSKLESSLRNIGIGGLCFISSQSYSLFETVFLKLALPINQYLISSNAQVVWVVKTHVDGEEKYDIGLEFKGLKKQDKDKIERFVERLIAIGGYDTESDNETDTESKEAQPV